MKNKIILIIILLLALYLRVPLLDKYPAGLNADEAAIGYNAYSLLKTGLDEHGSVWPLDFRSFDDYKPGGYFYLVLPFVAVLGLNVWAVRLPSALLGVVSVLFVHLLVNKLFPKSQILNLKSKITVGHLAALFLAISPWHLQYSRGGWEANVASVFMLVGLYFLFKSLENIKYFFLTTFSFVFSLYTYHSLRVVIPLVFVSFVIIYFAQIKSLLANSKTAKSLIYSIILGVLLLMPLTLQLLRPSGSSRFVGVSVFADTGPLWEALELRRADYSNLYAKVLHNRYATYSFRIAKNYLSHFSPRFLFITGDEIARNKVPGMGQAYLWTAPFLLLGIYFLLRNHNQGSKLILSWLFTAPLAAALTFQSPHALRAQNVVYPLVIISALGISEFLTLISTFRQKILLVASCVLLAAICSYETARYLHQYYVHYPKELALAWQYGFDQIAAYIKVNGDQYDQIIISDRYDQPYILMAFYLKLPPEQLQQAILTPRDRFGFSTVRNLGKLAFHRIDFGVDSKVENALIVVADEGAPNDQAIYRINDPGGRVMYRFYDTNKLK